jgi:hypothetical protein
MKCPGTNGKDVKIRYGDSKIDVTHKAVICVGETQPGTYYYRVIVPGVGEIDPRVDVGR